MNVYKPRLKKNILQRVNVFSIRVVNAWNTLPKEVMSASTVNSLKNRLGRFNKYRHGAQEASA